MFYKGFKIEIRAIDENKATAVHKNLESVSDVSKAIYKFIVLDDDCDSNCISCRFKDYYDTIEEAVSAIDVALGKFPVPLELILNSGEIVCMISGEKGPSIKEAEEFASDVLAKGERVISIALSPSGWDICTDSHMKVDDFPVFNRGNGDDDDFHLFDRVVIPNLDDSFKKELQNFGIILKLYYDSCGSVIADVSYNYISDKDSSIVIVAKTSELQKVC